METTGNIKRSLKVDLRDNVATALDNIESGDQIEIHGADGCVMVLNARDPIPFGHKVALKSIEFKENVIKYGASIGSSTSDISPGEHVHVHNLKSNRAIDRD